MLLPGSIFDDSGPLEDPLTDDVLRSVENQLGHRLPAAYIALARLHNGGSFRRDAHPAPNRTTWAEDGSRNGATPTSASTSPIARRRATT